MSTLPIIFLFTPQHTGTHFVRMLLETHPAIGFCVNESRRIDSAMREAHCLAGTGAGASGPPHERRLDDIIVDHFHGRLSEADFSHRYDYCLRQSIERFPGRTVADVIRATSGAQFRELGLVPAEKTPRFRLFHGHCGPKYREASLEPSSLRFVVTLRHPLLSLISALRRTDEPAVAEDLIEAFDIVLGLRGAFFFCTDLWQGRPEAMRGLFTTLGLNPSAETEAFLQLQPRVNETVVRGPERPSRLQEPEAARASPARLAELQDARALLLAEGRIHPGLRPWWARICERGIDERMERFGYDFTNA